MAFLFGAGVSADTTARIWLWSMAGSIFLFYTLRWFIWDPLSNSWKEFQKEQQSLFEKIKNSDKA